MTQQLKRRRSLGLNLYSRAPLSVQRWDRRGKYEVVRRDATVRVTSILYIAVLTAVQCGGCTEGGGLDVEEGFSVKLRRSVSDTGRQGM